MAMIFAELKLRGVSVEMAPEYAKELVWHEADFDQDHIFSVQARRVSLASHTDLIITDGPLLQQLIYAEDSDLQRRILSEYHRYDNFDVLLTRSETLAYDARGRYADEATARIVDEEVAAMLALNVVDFVALPYEGRNTATHLLKLLAEFGWA